MTKEINVDALSEATKKFADEMEGRYGYYTTTSPAERKANPHPLYSKSDHVYKGGLNIALLAQGALGLDQETESQEQRLLQENIADKVAKDWGDDKSPYMNEVWNSDALKGNPDVARILRTQAQFVLYNTPDTNSVKYTLTRAFGEVVGLFGARAIRDSVRSLPEMRKKAEADIQRYTM